jgi:uncharacterized coiled-coil DUF342 family protein
VTEYSAKLSELDRLVAPTSERGDSQTATDKGETMTSSYAQSTTAVRQLAGDVRELGLQLEKATPLRDDVLAAFRALITAVRKLRNQCDEHSATIESLKAERCELYRLIDALCAQNDAGRVRAYANQMVP